MRKEPHCLSFALAFAIGALREALRPASPDELPPRRPRSPEEVERLLARIGSPSDYLAVIGRRGGKARLKTMTPETRRAIASKAGKASAAARVTREQAVDRRLSTEGQP